MKKSSLYIIGISVTTVILFFIFFPIKNNLGSPPERTDDEQFEKITDRIDKYGLITPKNFTLDEYLNKGPFSAHTDEEKKEIEKDFLKLSKVEQQKCLSILFALQPYREYIGFNIHITSGYRSIRHELNQKRSGHSFHTRYGVDLRCNTKEKTLQLAEFLRKNWIGGYKYYENLGIIHIDLGPHRNW